MKFRRLLPYRRLVLSTALSGDIVRQQIALLLDNGINPYHLQQARTTRKYDGTLSDDSFTMSPRATLENTPTTTIKGTIDSAPQSTTISIDMQLTPGSKAIVYIIYIVATVFLFNLLRNDIMDTRNVKFKEYCEVALITLFPLALFYGGFWHESRRAKSDLLEWLQAREVTPHDPEAAGV